MTVAVLEAQEGVDDRARKDAEGAELAVKAAVAEDAEEGK